MHHFTVEADTQPSAECLIISWTYICKGSQAVLVNLLYVASLLITDALRLICDLYFSWSPTVVAEASAEAAHIISAISEVLSVPAPGTSDESPPGHTAAGQHWIIHTAFCLTTDPEPVCLHHISCCADGICVSSSLHALKLHTLWFPVHPSAQFYHVTHANKFCSLCVCWVLH